MIRKYFVVAACALIVVGCQVPANVKELSDENQTLKGQLNNANQQISQLKAQERLLQKDIAELNRVVTVLDAEKGSRVRESSQLRGQIRKFQQQQIDELKEFLVREDLLDYIGGELVERAQVEEKPLLIVDLAHAVPKNGTLTGVGGYFAKPAPFKVKVLRQVENDLVVIWESKPLTPKQPGLNRINFPVTVGVEQGDVLGYYFPTLTGVTFDTGSGDTRYLQSDLRPGGKVRRSALLGDGKKRAYSIGVYALLN
ncbi:MAG: hypothetical protein DWQ09_15975 [Proteobacteria bacterium]|nr:MAG: hypothetical protein DWQ09_15975 [Pseudomonadota bacterium]